MKDFGSSQRAISIVFASFFLSNFLGGTNFGVASAIEFLDGGNCPSSKSQQKQQQLPEQSIQLAHEFPPQLTHVQNEAIEALLEQHIFVKKKEAIQALVYETILYKLFPPRPHKKDAKPSDKHNQEESAVEESTTTLQLLQTAVELQPFVGIQLEKIMKKQHHILFITEQNDKEQIGKVADALIQALQEVRDKVRTPLFRLIQQTASPSVSKSAIYEEFLKRIYNEKNTYHSQLQEFFELRLVRCLDPQILDNLLTPWILHALKGTNASQQKNAISNIVDILYKSFLENYYVQGRLSNLIDHGIRRQTRGYRDYEKRKFSERILSAFLQQLSSLASQNKTIVSAIRAEIAEHLEQTKPFSYSDLVSDAIKHELNVAQDVPNIAHEEAYPIIADKMIKAFERVVAFRKDVEDTFSDHLNVQNTHLLVAFLGQKDDSAVKSFKEALLTLKNLDPELFRDYVHSSEVSFWYSPYSSEALNTLHKIAQVSLQSGMEKLGLKYATVKELKEMYRSDRNCTSEHLTVVCEVLKLISREFYQRFGKELVGVFVVRMAYVFRSDLFFPSRGSSPKITFDSLIKDIQAKLLELLSADFVKRNGEKIGSVLRIWLEALANLEIVGREVIRITGDFLDQWTLLSVMLYEKLPELERHYISDDDVVPGLSGLPTLLWILPTKEQRSNFLKVVVNQFVARGRSLWILQDTITNALIGRRNLDTLRSGLSSKTHTREENDIARAFLLKHAVFLPGWDSKTAEFLVGELSQALDWYPQLETMLFDKKSPSFYRYEFRKMFSRDVFHVLRALPNEERKTLLKKFASENQNRQKKIKSGDQSTFISKDFEEAFGKCLWIHRARDGKTTISSLLEQFFPKENKNTKHKDEKTDETKTTIQERFQAFQSALQKTFRNSFTECLLKKFNEGKTK